ncbi:MAG: preprotein translocase subunit SecY [Propioniciclava sp.]|uniref:preprotein translocase subunit SecY n=1 Tax=Propioniciclava sp. TaxID=2038686 RepID=UPI0039E53F9C
MLSAFAHALRTPDLRRKILFTLGILAVFRFGSVVPTPNVNMQNVQECTVQASTGASAGLYSMINLFSGGALLQLTVFALGIMPYITASIILQLLTVVIPRLETLKKEGGAGQQKITQYTRYLTLVLAVMQSTAFVTMAVGGQLFPGCGLALVYDATIFPILTMVLTMTAGTGIVMWLGELVTERGVGNGMSVMIFTQIAAAFPAQVWGIAISAGTIEWNGFTLPNSAGWLAFLAVLAVGALVMLGVIFVEQAQRRIPVQYAKRMVGRRLVGGSTTYIPIKVNQAGVIPVIFASSLLSLPIMLSQFAPESAASSWIAANLGGQGLWHNLLMFALIIAFAYFYVSITFNPEEVADNMRKYGGFIPGIRAGKPTERYLGYVLSRLTAPGSLYLGLIALLPAFAFMFLPGGQQFPFGGTSILIVVGVGLDTVKQIQSQLQQRNYEGFLR